MDIVKTIENLNKPLQMAVPLVSKLTSAFQSIASAGGVVDMFANIANLVGKFDPSIVERFGIVVDDLMAVVGQMLRPVLEAGITALRKFADLVATIAPAFDPVIKSMIDIIEIASSMLVPMFKILTPIIQIIGQYLQVIFIPMFKLLSDVMIRTGDVILAVIKRLVAAYNQLANTKIGRAMGLSQIKMMDEFKAQSSFGKAARNTGTMDGEELGRQMRLAALRAGGVDSEEVKATKSVVKEVMKIHETIWEAMGIMTSTSNQKAAADAGRAFR